MNIKYTSLFSLLLIVGRINAISYQEQEKARQKNEAACFEIKYHSKGLKMAQQKQSETWKKFSNAVDQFVKPLAKKVRQLQKEKSKYENDYVEALKKVKKSPLYPTYQQARSVCLYENNCYCNEAFKKAEEEFLAEVDGKNLHEMEKKFLPIALKEAILHIAVNSASASGYNSTYNAMDDAITTTFDKNCFDSNYYFSNLSDVKCVGRHEEICNQARKELRQLIAEACDQK